MAFVYILFHCCAGGLSACEPTCYETLDLFCIFQGNVSHMLYFSGETTKHYEVQKHWPGVVN